MIFFKNHMSGFDSSSNKFSVFLNPAINGFGRIVFNAIMNTW